VGCELLFICYLDEFQVSGILVNDVFVLDFSYSVTQSFQIKYSIYIYIYMCVCVCVCVCVCMRARARALMSESGYL
jgi:hypothetical protein